MLLGEIITMFRISMALNSFFRLVNSIRTTKDTLDLRDKLLKTRLQISELVKNTSAKLIEASEADHHGVDSPIRKIADAKLANDFQSVLKEFQKAQRLAAEREITYTPHYRYPYQVGKPDDCTLSS